MVYCKPMGMDGTFMEDIAQLSLLNVPWPISILKCNQRLDEMLSGERLDITLKDPYTKDNLVMLLNAMPLFEFEICFSEGCYLLSIRKRYA